MLLSLSHWIREELDRATGSREDRFSDTLTKVLHTFDLADIVQAAMADENRADVARRSYRHPNGFTKIVLIQFQAGSIPFELRLHDWYPVAMAEPNDILLSRESVHDHGWDFASYIVSGALLFEEFEVSSQGQEFSEFKYVRLQSEIQYSRRYVGKRLLQCSRRGTHKHPDVYFFPRNKLHRTIPVHGERTISLMLQSPYAVREAKVFRDLDQPEVRELPAQRALSELELVESLEGILSHLVPTVKGSDT
jgi:hypothetical protein